MSRDKRRCLYASWRAVSEADLGPFAWTLAALRQFLILVFPISRLPICHLCSAVRFFSHRPHLHFAWTTCRDFVSYLSPLINSPKVVVLHSAVFMEYLVCKCRFDDTVIFIVFSMLILHPPKSLHMQVVSDVPFDNSWVVCCRTCSRTIFTPSVCMTVLAVRRKTAAFCSNLPRAATLNKMKASLIGTLPQLHL